MIGFERNQRSPGQHPLRHRGQAIPLSIHFDLRRMRECGFGPEINQIRTLRQQDFRAPNRLFRA